MDLIELILSNSSAGIALGGILVWVVMTIRSYDKTNRDEHGEIYEALKEHAKADGAKLDKLDNTMREVGHKIDTLIDVIKLNHK